MLEVNDAFKHGRYEQIWLKTAHIEFLPRNIRRTDAGRTTGRADVQTRLITKTHFPAIWINKIIFRFLKKKFNFIPTTMKVSSEIVLFFFAVFCFCGGFICLLACLFVCLFFCLFVLGLEGWDMFGEGIGG